MQTEWIQTELSVSIKNWKMNLSIIETKFDGQRQLSVQSYKMNLKIPPKVRGKNSV